MSESTKSLPASSACMQWYNAVYILSSAADTEDIGIIGTAFLNYVPDTLKLKEEIIMQRREEEWRRQEQQEYSSSSDDELSTTSTSPYDTDPPS